MIMELNRIFFDDLGIRRPDYFLNSAKNSCGVANTIGNLITAVDRVLAEVEPHAMLILGDTNSCLSVIPAKREKYQLSTWKQAIVVLTCVFLRNKSSYC